MDHGDESAAVTSIAHHCESHEFRRMALSSNQSNSLLGFIAPNIQHRNRRPRPSQPHSDLPANPRPRPSNQGLASVEVYCYCHAFAPINLLGSLRRKPRKKSILYPVRAEAGPVPSNSTIGQTNLRLSVYAIPKCRKITGEFFSAGITLKLRLVLRLRPEPGLQSFVLSRVILQHRVANRRIGRLV